MAGREVVIVGAARTPIGSFLGSLAAVTAPRLGAVAIRAAIALGDADVIVAGGMESMSNGPYYDRAARAGVRMGNVELVDGMIHDGLWDVYGQQHMGMCAEHCATTRGISRAAQDEYAIESTRRAIEAARSGAFKAEIVPVERE